MCIIAIKPKGKKMIDNNTLNTMFIANPDGAGYMYYDAKSKKVVIKKGFMTCKSLIASLNSKDFTNTNVILHFRIGTSGLNDALNCHPYPINQKNTLRCKTNLAMAHNGILHNFNPPKGSKINDTQIFINDVLNGLKPNFLNDADKVNLIKMIIGTNKLAFLDNKNKITMIGDFINDNGYYYSNNTYQVDRLHQTCYGIAYGGHKNVCPPKHSTVKSVSKIDNDYDFWADDADSDYDDFWADWDLRHTYL